MRRVTQRSLRGKAFLCASVIGNNSGKEIFAQDACAVMDVVVPLFQAGFAADSSLRENAHEAAGNIIETIGKGFKPYVQALLPSVFEVLKQTPKDITELLCEELEEDVVLNDLGSMGFKMDTTTEMEEALTLLSMLAEQLDEEFCDYIADTVQVLLPILDHPLPEDVRLRLFKTWGQLARCARNGVQCGKLGGNVITGLATEFLKKTIGLLARIEA